MHGTIMPYQCATMLLVRGNQLAIDAKLLAELKSMWQLIEKTVGPLLDEKIFLLVGAEHAAETIIDLEKLDIRRREQLPESKSGSESRDSAANNGQASLSFGRRGQERNPAATWWAFVPECYQTLRPVRQGQ